MNARSSASIHDALPVAGCRPGRLDLSFRRVRGRTRIGEQFASYPFHLTRCFDLDEDIPRLATIYMQSSSGGLYRGEDLGVVVSVGDGAAAHVTTQSATIVHDSRGEPATQTVRLSVGAGAFLAFAPDPVILFPGAALACVQTIRVAPGSVVFLSDVFATHDPMGSGRPFERYSADVMIEDEEGRLLVSDRMSVTGKSLAGSGSPQGDWPTAGTAFILGDVSRLPDRAAICAAIDGRGAVAGVTALPNKAGYGVRCLAADSRIQKHVSEALFALLVRFHFGVSPTLRRK